NAPPSELNTPIPHGCRRQRPSSQPRVVHDRRVRSGESNSPESDRLHAASPGKLAGLKAFLTEDRAPLRRLEGNRRLLTAGRARGDGFHPFPRRSAPHRAAGPLALAGLAPLRLVLEVLVGEELLLSRRPHELRAAVDAPEDPVLELHRSLPRRG